MSFRDLVSGDCGGQNPVVRMAKQYTDKERPQLLQQRPHQRPQRQGHGEQHLVEEFLEHTGTKYREPRQAFRMDNLIKEMDGMEEREGINQVKIQDRERNRLMEKVDEERQKRWTEEFLQESNKGDEAKMVSEKGDLWSEEFRFRSGISKDDNKWAEEYLGEEVPIMDEGTNRMAEIAGQIAASGASSKSLRKSGFIRFMESIASGESVLAGGKFVRRCRDAEKLACECQNFEAEDVQWAEEFADLTDADFEKIQNSTEAYKADFWNKMEEEWSEMAKSEEHPWLSDFQDGLGANFQNYKFEEANPLKDHPNPLEEGKERLAQGDIPSAALLFEAAVQRNGDNVEAWTLLGTTQAKNEQDPAAISALRRAVELDPGNLAAHMALAVSYTNESYQGDACSALQDWLQQNPKYSDLVAKPEGAAFRPPSSFMSQQLHQETLSMFLSAARSSREVDADVQSGLGILFNLSGDYEKAVDCFRSALQVRPEDPQLWNKLGATLANGDRSEEAVSAYHSALQHSPGFVRSRYNLGISCMNLKAYQEAAEHFLAALNFQASGRGVDDTKQTMMSESIWSSLRLCASFLNRRNELHPLINAKDLEKLNTVFKRQTPNPE